MISLKETAISALLVIGWFVSFGFIPVEWAETWAKLGILLLLIYGAVMFRKEVINFH